MITHKSLKAWQEAEWVVSAVIDISQSCYKPWLGAVFSQLQRSSLSVQINIAEGYSFMKTPTFVRHLSVAYGSAVETGELLELLARKKVVPADQAAEVIEHCRASQRLLLGLIKRFRRTTPRQDTKPALT